MSSNASTPAPPYTGAPPSNAEMAAEVQQLRNTINTLRAQMNARPAVNNEGGNHEHRERDPGEALKPPKPEPFRGQASDVIPFLTRMKGYFRLFPNRLDSPTKKLLFTAPLIQGAAKDWFEPIMRDYLENEENLQDQDTQNIFGNWENFEQALKDNFGVVNEERQAAAELLALRQHKSCAAHSAKFRQLAAKTQWDDDSLMEIYYRSLKEEVKDELYLADRPEDLTTYITMAVKIDERQYERRKERANHKRGNDFNPYYPNQRRNNNNQGNSRNQRQQRGFNRSDTSYGSHEGPMTLGVTRPDNGNRGQRDMSKCKCYNCNQFGHMARQCPQPRKPRDPNHGKQTLGLTRQLEPQMVKRTQTLGMVRSGYDVPSEKGQGITWLEPEEPGKTGKKKELLTPEEVEEKRIRRNKMQNQNYHRYMEDPEKRKHLNEQQKKRRQEANKRKLEEFKKQLRMEKPQTLGVIREGKTIIPNTEDSGEPSRLLNDIPIRTTLQNKEEHWKQEVEAGNQLRQKKQRSSRNMGHRGKHAKITAQYLRHRDEQISQKWEEPYEKEIDEDGLRIYNTQEDICIQGAREHWDTETGTKVYIRAYHTNDALNPLHPEPRFDTQDDVRTMPTHPQHGEIAWVSCKNHWCEQHRLDKMDNDCFPITIPGTPNDRPYLTREIEGYSVYLWYDYLGVAELRFNMALYRKTHKVNELTQGIKENMKIIEEAEKELNETTQGRYEHLRKELSIDDTSSEDTEEIQCNWEADGLHMTQDIPPGQAQPSKNEALDEELEEEYQQRLFDEEFLNDCPNGEGCNDSDCEQMHRDTSGKVTRHL